MALIKFLTEVLLMIFFVNGSKGGVTADGCGTTKTCYRNPADCAPTDADCRFVSWKMSDTGDTYEFELSGSPGNGEDYIAMALGTINRMKNADLYYCDGNALASGAITDPYQEPTYLPLENGLVQKSAATENGVAQCVLTRPRSVTKAITTGNNDYDIVSNEYYLLVATGKTKVGEDGIQRHTWRTVTNNRYNFSSTPIATTQSPTTQAQVTDDQVTTNAQVTQTQNTEAPVTDDQVTTNAQVTQTQNTEAPVTDDQVTTNAQATQTQGSTVTAISREGCGTTKTCFSNPENCAFTDTGCRFYSWRKSSSGEAYDFEMSGSAGGGDAYIAFALGTTNAMKDADLYYCDGETIHSGVITALHKEPTYLALQNGLGVKSARTVDGVAQCVLTRSTSITKTISNGSYAFNIETHVYWLLVAQGLTKENGIQPHTWKMVGEKYSFSSGQRFAALQPAVLSFVAVVVMILSDSFTGQE